MRWQDFEKIIKNYSEIIWLASAESMMINGVKCDCVIKKQSDHYIIVEVSKENTLEKLRLDLAKFATIKPALLAQGIYAECIFVTEKDTYSLKTSAEGQNVSIHSITSFFNTYVGSAQYIRSREDKPFGSAIDQDSGDQDKYKYIPIKYSDYKGKEYSVEDISDLLTRGNKVVVLGEFGSGKSRCIMELFHILSYKNKEIPPIAINLKDVWGLRSFHTIITEHFARLGLSQFSDNLIRSISFGQNVILLDGFDELGSQAWSGDKNRLKEVRKRSFEGVRDLISNAKKSGILITGREHYFSKNNELFECMGLKENDCIVLRCPDEFTEEEARDYLKSTIGIQIYPQWFPRKPLLCQVLIKLEEDERRSIFIDESGEITYFEKTLDIICSRETKYNPAVYADSVKQLYLELARIVKEKDSRIGPLTNTDIYNAFEKVTGSPPLDESIVLLQRLAYLGRTDSESEDRVFIDEYIADGLTALAITDDYFHKREYLEQIKWKQSVSYFGLRVIGKKIKINQEYIDYLKIIEKENKHQLSSDLIAAVINENTDINFQSVNSIDANIHYLDLTNRCISNISFVKPTIENLVIDDSRFENVKIIDGIFGNTMGVTSKSGFSKEFVNCDSEQYENAQNAANISQLEISSAHKTLLVIIKKLFLQPGGGRKEEALLRGSERFWEKDAAKKILNYLVTNNYITKSKGDTGWVYNPERKYKPKLEKMYAELNNSSEELWKMF